LLNAVQEGGYESANTQFLRELQVGLEFGDRDPSGTSHGWVYLDWPARWASTSEPVNLAGAAETLREAAGSPLHEAWRRRALVGNFTTALGEAAYSSA
jgi:hypothetical protein